MSIFDYIPHVLFGAVVIYLIYDKVKDKGYSFGGGSKLDTLGDKVVVKVKFRWDLSTVRHKGGDNGQVEELPGGKGIIINGDQPVPGRGKKQTAIWSFAGRLRDVKAFDFVAGHMGKCYGVFYNGVQTLALISRSGSMDKGLLNVEVVDAFKPEDGKKSWTMQQVPGAGDCGNHTFVRGYTGAHSYVLGLVMRDRGILKWAFKSWDSGAKILQAKTGTEMNGALAWKKVGKMKGLGARHGMATTITAIRPRGCKNHVIVTCDMIVGKMEVHRTTPANTVVGSLQGKTVRILGPTDLPDLRRKHGVNRTKHSEFGNSQEHAWTGPLTGAFFENQDGTVDFVVTGTYEMDANYIVPVEFVYA